MNNKTIRVKLEQVRVTKTDRDNGNPIEVSTSYTIEEMTNAVTLDSKWFGLDKTVRVGDSISEVEATKLANAKSLEVRIVA